MKLYSTLDKFTTGHGLRTALHSLIFKNPETSRIYRVPYHNPHPYAVAYC